MLIGYHASRRASHQSAGAITCRYCVTYVTQQFVSIAQHHIHVTLLITYISVQVDYQLFVYQSLIIHMYFISEYMRHIT